MLPQQPGRLSLGTNGFERTDRQNRAAADALSRLNAAW